MTLRPFLLSVPILVAASVLSVAHALPVIVNGGFETTSLTASAQVTTTNVTGWSTSGYNFLFLPGTATTTGAASTSYGQFYLSGTLPSGASNGFTSTSPTGGNFLAADGDFQVGAITQTITNLLPNTRYSVSFLWGAGQQKSYTPATTEQWKVTLGSEEHDTTVVNNPSQGFTNWMSQTFTYTATAASEVLSFLAAGGPGGAPPFVLLDGVSIVTTIAEPASWMTLVVAVASVVSVLSLQRHTSRLASTTGERQPAGKMPPSKLRRRHRRSYARGSAC